jgi:PAS domain S-box-containing protein
MIDNTSDAAEQLRSLADNLPGGMVYQVVAGPAERRFLFVSQGVMEIFGVEAEKVLADAGALYGCIRPDQIPEMIKAEEEALQDQKPFLAEVAITTPGGDEKWVRINSAPRTRSDGLQVWDGIVLDITAQKTADLKHLLAERRLAIATEAANIGIWDWDLQTGVMNYSQLARQICGFSPTEEITYTNLRALTNPEDFQHTSPALKRALDPAIRSNEVYTYRISRADDGQERWIRAHGIALFASVSGEEKAVSYIGTIQDITEQRLAEVALKDSQHRLELAIAAGRMAVWEMDVISSRVTPSVDLNRLYGFADDARPTADDYRNTYAPGERDRITQANMQALAEGANYLAWEGRHVLYDGQTRWLSVTAQITRDQENKPLAAIGIVLDVTERRRAEEQLKIVARELQHRVKNSLAVVQTIAAQTFRANRPLEEARKAFTGRLQALAIATDLITRTEQEQTDLADLVDQVTLPFRSGAIAAVRWSGPRASLPPQVATGLSMALHELGTNALKYGALTVPAGRVTIAWDISEDSLILTWIERNGPTVSSQAEQGFGTRLLERGIFEGQQGSVLLSFDPEGLTCSIKARLLPV